MSVNESFCPFFVHLPPDLVQPSLDRIEAALAASPVAGRSLAYCEETSDWSAGSSSPLDEVAGSLVAGLTLGGQLLAVNRIADRLPDLGVVERGLGGVEPHGDHVVRRHVRAGRQPHVVGGRILGHEDVLHVRDVVTGPSTSPDSTAVGEVPVAKPGKMTSGTWIEDSFQ